MKNLQVYILRLLFERGEQSSYALYMELSDRYPESRLNCGQLHTTLDQLVEQQLIASELRDPIPERGNRDQRMVRLTPAGEEFVVSFWHINREQLFRKLDELWKIRRVPDRHQVLILQLALQHAQNADWVDDTLADYVTERFLKPRGGLQLEQVYEFIHWLGDTLDYDYRLVVDRQRKQRKRG